MQFSSQVKGSSQGWRLACAFLCLAWNSAAVLNAQQTNAAEPPSALLAAGSIAGIITDTDAAGVPSAQVTLEDTTSKATRNTQSDDHGAFLFSSVPSGTYVVTVRANGFSPWKIKDVILLHESEDFLLPTVELGVESISTTVNAISMEDLAEQQITAEEHQRILGVLPNFFVSYVSDPAPLTRKQKFKLALVVSRDPLTFLTTGINAGIEQWQGDFAGYGQEFSGYAKRYGATYGDRLSSTFLGAALLPSLLHQDPRYFYRGHGPIMVRALYAISTVAVCKGDNGHWQPNYSFILGDLASGGISNLYYPAQNRNGVSLTFENMGIAVGGGAIGNVVQEFFLKRFTSHAPAPEQAKP